MTRTFAISAGLLLTLTLQVSAQTALETAPGPTMLIAIGTDCISADELKAADRNWRPDDKDPAVFHILAIDGSLQLPRGGEINVPEPGVHTLALQTGGACGWQLTHTFYE